MSSGVFMTVDLFDVESTSVDVADVAGLARELL
jgi:hypothetical protein